MTKESKILIPPFKLSHIDYRKLAIIRLAWLTYGLIEVPLELDGEIIFIPDVTCLRHGMLSCIYMVGSPGIISGRDLGMLQYYCFRKSLEITVYEISAGSILTQHGTSPVIVPHECYPINPFNPR